MTTASAEGSNAAEKVTYGLRSLTLGSTGILILKKAEYDSVRISQEKIANGLAIEEKFDVVVENFYDLEKEMLEISMDYMLFEIYHTDLWKSLNAVNRRIVNFLSACRLYQDHTIHHLKGIFADAEPVEKIIALRSSYYDGHLEYRVIEALRNYVQHRGYPAHSITLSSQKIDTTVGFGSVYGISVSIDPRQLRGDGKFKASVLKEIEASGEKVDFKPVARKYMEYICAIHEATRSSIKENIDEAEKVILSAEERYSSAYPEEKAWVVAVQQDEAGQILERHYLMSDQIEQRKSYGRKNGSFRNLASRHVSGEVLGEVRRRRR